MRPRAESNIEGKKKFRTPSFQFQNHPKAPFQVENKRLQIVKRQSKDREGRRMSADQITPNRNRLFCQNTKAQAGPRFLRSSSQAQIAYIESGQNTLQKIKNEKRISPKAKQPVSIEINQSNPENLLSREKKQRSFGKNRLQRKNTENDLKFKVEQLEFENSELKEKNKKLNKDLSKMKEEISSKQIQIKELETKITSLTTSINSSGNKYQYVIHQKNKAQSNFKNQSNLSPKQRSLSSGPSKEKQSIEKFLLDFDKNFDEMLNLERIHSENDSLDESKQENLRYQETILKLNQKVRVLEVENTMLKRFKYEIRQFKAKCEKLKGQVKILSNKLKFLTGNNMMGKEKNSKNKDPLEYTVSFEFSLEDERNTMFDKRKFRD